MTQISWNRPLRSGLVAATALVLALGGVTLGSESPDDHAVVGRFGITSDAGGAVWAFRPGGTLVVVGPGDIMSGGTWSSGPGEREFDAMVDYEAAGQSLDVQGQVSPDGAHVAVHVVATDASRPEDAEPWPPGSRLIGTRVGMAPDVTPSPSPAPPDCLRPEWISGTVDWDRCDSILPSEA